MEALVPCELLLHVHRNTMRHVADDRKIAQPRESQISVDHSFPRKQCLFRVTWIALFLNQRWIILAAEGWCYQGDILESGARHSRYSPLPLEASGEEVMTNRESRVTKQKPSWYVRGYQRVYAQMFVNGNIAFQTSDGLLGTYQQSFFCFPLCMMICQS